MAALIYIIAGTFVLLALSIPGLLLALSLMGEQPCLRASKALRGPRRDILGWDDLPPSRPANEQSSLAA